MADINVVLRINEDGNGVIESFRMSKTPNNTSLVKSQEISSLLDYLSANNKDYGGGIGTPIGLTTIGNLRFGVLNSNNVRQKTYNGLDYGYTDNNKIFNLTITIVGVDVISFKIIFDRLRGQYPTNYSWVDIGGSTHNVRNNTSNELTFEQQAGVGTTTITFSEWSLANTMVGITFVENVEIDMFMDKRWIKSFETMYQSKTDVSQFNFSPIASTGQIKLIDVDKSLFNKAELGYLNNNVFSLEIYLNSLLNRTHITNDSPYFSVDSNVQLQLSDLIQKWNNIIVPDLEIRQGTSMLNVLEEVLNYYDEDYFYKIYREGEGLYNRAIIQDSNGLEHFDSVETLFGATVTSTFTLKSGSIVEQLRKICNALFLTCYIGEEDYLYFASARPVYRINHMGDTILIPFNKQYSKPNYDILANNRYDDVDLS